jgi:hypothetical protein
MDEDKEKPFRLVPPPKLPAGDRQLILGRDTCREAGSNLLANLGDGANVRAGQIPHRPRRT